MEHALFYDVTNGEYFPAPLSADPFSGTTGITSIIGKIREKTIAGWVKASVRAAVKTVDARLLVKEYRRELTCRIRNGLDVAWEQSCEDLSQFTRRLISRPKPRTSGSSIEVLKGNNPRVELHL